MVIRDWRGATTAQNADAYVEHLRTAILPEIEAIEGFRGVYVLRRSTEAGVEFRVLTLWASHDAIREFAGANPDVAVVPPEARALLSDFDEHVVHFEVAHHAGDS